MPRIKRFLSKSSLALVRATIFALSYINIRTYMKYYLKYLRARGMVIRGAPRYIAVKCWFDGTDYGLIELGHNVVISSNTRVLTHDYSATLALMALGVEVGADVANIRPVAIGDNSFIGTGSILMPGCRIGKNVIVGAGSVVRGEVPDNSIILGNPATVVGDTLDWGRKQLNLLNEHKLSMDPDWWGGRQGGDRTLQS